MRAKRCKKEQTGDRHLIGRERGKEIWDQGKADCIAGYVEQYPGDAASVRVIDDPRPDDADENIAQYKEDEIDMLDSPYVKFVQVTVIK
jgi:hypothetical protein